MAAPLMIYLLRLAVLGGMIMLMMVLVVLMVMATRGPDVCDHRRPLVERQRFPIVLPAAGAGAGGFEFGVEIKRPLVGPRGFGVARAGPGPGPRTGPRTIGGVGVVRHRNVLVLVVLLRQPVAVVAVEGRLHQLVRLDRSLAFLRID